MRLCPVSTIIYVGCPGTVRYRVYPVGTIIYVGVLLRTDYSLSVGTICVWFEEMEGLRVKRNTGSFNFIITRNCP